MFLGLFAAVGVSQFLKVEGKAYSFPPKGTEGVEATSSPASSTVTVVFLTFRCFR